MITDLFESGNIYLIQEPVNGNAGIPRLFAQLLDGYFGIEINDDEYYAIFSNSTRKLLIIFYKNNKGVGVFKWRLYSRKLKFILDGNSDKPIKITRSQMKNLILNGTIID